MLSQLQSYHHLLLHSCNHAAGVALALCRQWRVMVCSTRLQLGTSQGSVSKSVTRFSFPPLDVQLHQAAEQSSTHQSAPPVDH
jgi:hypothetical protein